VNNQYFKSILENFIHHLLIVKVIMSRIWAQITNTRVHNALQAILYIAKSTKCNFHILQVTMTFEAEEVHDRS
jgi:hypothetical protein